MCELNSDMTFIKSELLCNSRNAIILQKYLENTQNYFLIWSCFPSVFPLIHVTEEHAYFFHWYIIFKAYCHNIYTNLNIIFISHNSYLRIYEDILVVSTLSVTEDSRL